MTIISSILGYLYFKSINEKTIAINDLNLLKNENNLIKLENEELKNENNHLNKKINDLSNENKDLLIKTTKYVSQIESLKQQKIFLNYHDNLLKKKSDIY